MKRGADSTSYIIGAEGQDGLLISELLKNEGKKVIQIGRKYLINSEIRAPFDSADKSQINELFLSYPPSDIYFLAADHSPSNIDDIVSNFKKSKESEILDLLVTFLEGIRHFKSDCRFFYASSCLVFGEPKVFPQNEFTDRAPIENYAKIKLKGEEILEFYKNHYNLYTVTGILYSHESEFRRSDFLFSKILKHAVNSASGANEILQISNLDSFKDWSAARDIVNGVVATLIPESPYNYVIGCGELHSVREICETAFNYFELNFEDYVIQSEIELFRKAPKIPFLADYSSLKIKTGWEPKISFKDLIENTLQVFNRRK